MLSANLTNAQRRAIYRRDNFACALCDSNRGLQIHHVIHRSQGGSDSPQNLITVCWRCHAVLHGTRLPEYPDWMGPENLEQAAIEYVADYYAGSWWPWEKTWREMREEGV